MEGRASIGRHTLKIPNVHASLNPVYPARIFTCRSFILNADVPLLKRSLDLWHELDDFYKSEVLPTKTGEGVADAPDRILNMCGGLMIGAADTEVVSGTMRSVITHDMPHEELGAKEMRQRFPMFKLSENEVAIYEANAGYLMAELCVESFITMARKHGAELHFEETMLDWEDVEGTV